jgi:hypothetical protein
MYCTVFPEHTTASQFRKTGLGDNYEKRPACMVQCKNVGDEYGGGGDE